MGALRSPHAPDGMAYSPDARQIWRGSWPRLRSALARRRSRSVSSDMANRLTVRFSEPGGAQGDSTVYSSAASQALFGRKRPRDQRLNGAQRGGQQPGADDSTISPSRAPNSPARRHHARRSQYHAHVLGQIRAARLAADRQHQHDQHGEQHTDRQPAHELHRHQRLLLEQRREHCRHRASDTEYIEPDNLPREDRALAGARNSAQQPSRMGLLR